MPRVAVLLPARDAARTVRAAVASVLRQEHRDLAVVAVDDGSRDATGAILDDLARRDRRLRVLHGPGEGIVGALRRGLAAVDAEVVVRMDADDVSRPGRVSRQLAALDGDPALAAVGSRVRLFPRRLVAGGMARYAAWLNGLVMPELVERDLLVESPLVHPEELLLLARAHARLGDRTKALLRLDQLLRILERADPDLPRLAEARALRRELAPGAGQATQR